MPVLSRLEIEQGYFHDIGGFPQSDKDHHVHNSNFAVELSEYRGQDKLCIACTQLPGENVTVMFSDIKGYSKSDQKRILTEWIDFLRTNTKTFKALHFNTRVPQTLFNAACCQENLVELRFKWGAYSDLSALANLQKLQYLYIGSGASVTNMAILGELKNLIVLYI